MVTNQKVLKTKFLAFSFFPRFVRTLTETESTNNNFCKIKKKKIFRHFGTESRNALNKTQKQLKEEVEAKISASAKQKEQFEQKIKILLKKKQDNKSVQVEDDIFFGEMDLKINELAGIRLLKQRADYKIREAHIEFQSLEAPSVRALSVKHSSVTGPSIFELVDGPDSLKILGSIPVYTSVKWIQDAVHKSILKLTCAEIEDTQILNACASCAKLEDLCSTFNSVARFSHKELELIENLEPFYIDAKARLPALLLDCKITPKMLQAADKSLFIVQTIDERAADREPVLKYRGLVKREREVEDWFNLEPPLKQQKQDALQKYGSMFMEIRKSTSAFSIQTDNLIVKSPATNGVSTKAYWAACARIEERNLKALEALQELSVPIPSPSTKERLENLTPPISPPATPSSALPLSPVTVNFLWGYMDWLSDKVNWLIR